MSEFDFIECTEEELLKYKQNYNLELNWDMATKVLKILFNEKTVGLIQISNSDGMYNNEDSVQIDNFEVFEKGKGIGSEIVTKILDEFRGTVIYLYAHSEKSKAFWEKHNFITGDDGSGTMIHRYSIV